MKVKKPRKVPPKSGRPQDNWCWRHNNEHFIPRPLQHPTLEDTSSEALHINVNCYTLMNGKKIYFKFEKGTELYWDRVSEKNAVKNVPDKLVFAGELNGSLHFYTVARDDEDLLQNYTFYELCESENGSYELVIIGTVKKDRQMPEMFACQQPYYCEVSEDKSALVKNFKGETIIVLSKSEWENIDMYRVWKFFVQRETMYVLRFCDSDDEETTITEDNNVITIIMQDGRRDDHTHTSTYDLDGSLMYILSNKVLLVVADKTFMTFDIGEAQDDSTIGGVDRGRLLINRFKACIGKDLLEEDSRKMAIEDYEKLPEHVTLYRLMNGTKVFFRNHESNELYSESNEKVDGLPSEKLICGGEWDDSLYFYTQKEKTYAFYKCAFEVPGSPGKFEKIRDLKTSVPLGFLLNQPFYVFSLTDGAIVIESFDKSKSLEVSSDNAVHKDMFNKSNQLFVRRGTVYFVDKRTTDIVNVGTGKTVKDVMIAHFSMSMNLPIGVSINLEDRKNRFANLPAPISVYAQDTSLVYILFGTRLFVVGEHFDFESFDIGTPNCTICGVEYGKVYLTNDNNEHFSIDVGKELDRMLVDEGFESAPKTGQHCETCVVPSSGTFHLDREFKRLLATRDRLNQETTDQQMKVRKLKESLEKLRLSGEATQRKPTFISKFLKEFDFDDTLGTGGGGSVFKAMNKFDECKYAVKRIAVDPIEKLIDQSLKEVRAMAQLDHPGIVRYNSTWIERPPEGWQFDADATMMKRRQLFNYNANSCFIYIQMQLCNYSLSDWLEESRSSESRKLVRMKSWFRQIAAAVAYIHENHLIHSDLKPSNILFVENDHLKICDLGIVTERKVIDGVEITSTNTGSGTRVYMSPEQFATIDSTSNKTRINSKSDVFTLGLILAELCNVMDYEMKVKVFDNYRRGRPNNIFDDHRTDAFVRQLTDLEKNKRPSCEEMLRDFYLA